MRWKVPEILWSGGSVWIIGGGPSIPHQFQIPDDIVQAVRNQERNPAAYEPYMRALKNKHVIAINSAFLIADWIDMVFFGDNKWFLPYQERLKRFPGLKVTDNVRLKNSKWVKCLERDKNKKTGIHNDPAKTSWNYNSGAAAINVAANAGAKRIFLLGFDMTDEGHKRHWHTLYIGTNLDKRQKRRGANKHKVKNVFGRHLKGFPQIKKDADRRGVEIINVSDISQIQEFRKMNLKEALEYDDNANT